MIPKPEPKFLMPKDCDCGHDHYEHPVSRDFSDVPCKRRSCKYNSDGQCTVPSRCVIGEDGRCEGYVPSITGGRYA